MTDTPKGGGRALYWFASKVVAPLAVWIGNLFQKKDSSK